MINKFTIVENLNSDQIEQLLALFHKMWWSTDRTREEVTTLLKSCLVFAVIDEQSKKLIGFARVLTDNMRYAYIYDVMTEEQYRGLGLGKMIMQHIINHPKLTGIKYIELTCAPDMEKYYEKFGFKLDFGNVISMRYTKTS